MKRLLPPLVVLLVIAAVALRYALDPAQESEKAAIVAGLAEQPLPPERARDLAREVERYLGNYGEDPEARWFAARSYLRLGRIQDAIRTIWDHGPTAEAPGTTRRFAELMLRVLGFFDPEELRRPTPAAGAALMILAEGGDPQALSRLDTVLREATQAEVVPLFYRAYLWAERDLLDRVVEGMRTREALPFHIGAAQASMRPTDYPHREEDLALLAETVRGDARLERRPLWSASCIALGRSEAREGRAALEAVVDGLADRESERARADRGVAAAGLVASGVWEAEAIARPLFDPDLTAEPDPFLMGWYTEAVLARLRRGDPMGLQRTRLVWRNSNRPQLLGLRARLASHLLLRERLDLPEDLVTTVVGELSAPGAPPTERIIVTSWRLRQGEAGAARTLIEELAGLADGPGEVPDVGLRDPNEVSPLFTGLRALYLYGSSSVH